MRDVPLTERLGCGREKRWLCKIDALLCAKAKNLAKLTKAQTLQQPNRCSIGCLRFSYHATKPHCAEGVVQ